MRSTAFRLLGLATASIALLAAAEATLRATAGPSPPPLVRLPGERVEALPAARLPGVLGDARVHVGEHGLRGDELVPDAAPRVLVVGGATAECRWLDQDETWPALLQRALGERAWVGNAGRLDHGSRQAVALARHLLPRLAVDRVVVLLGGEDLHLPLDPNHYDAAYLTRPERREELLRSTFDVVPPELLDPPPFPRDLALWRLVAGAPESPEVDPARDAEDLRRWRRHRAAAERPLDELPFTIERGLGEWRTNLGLVVDACLASGARPLLVTQPALWREGLAPEREELLWMGGVRDYRDVPDGYYYATAALAEGLARYNAALLEVARERGVPALDLAARLDDPALFYDDVRLNEEGARRAAELVAAALAEDAGAE